MTNGWRDNLLLAATALFGFVVFSPETFVHLPWLVALSKFAMAGGLISIGIASRQQSTANAAVIQKVDEQSTANAAAIQKVDDKVADTHAAINGRMDELVVAAKAVGAQEQRTQTRQDAKDAMDAKL